MRTNSNFSFAGAGQSVFGSTTRNSSEANEDDDHPHDKQAYEPYFKPLTPLPDVIGVKTGEEDEVKVFSQRATLFRYNSGTREWKERGTGEMKVLHRVGHGTYRLLLRREQVHKVVCNLLITLDLEILPLNTSEHVWMWAGMSFAEDTPAVETLAVRFRTPELAARFQKAVDWTLERLRGSVYESQIIEDDDDEYIHSVMYANETRNIIQFSKDEHKVSEKS